MNKMISYAYDFVSYLTLQPDIEKLNIEKVILFGSSVRGDFSKDSDVDIFVDLKKGDAKVVEKVKIGFFNSERLDKWSRLNIKNEINIIVGNLDDAKWRDLRRTMHSHAVVVYDRYLESEKKGLGAYSLIKWEIGSKENNKRVNLARKFYGYKQKGKEYNGILDEMEANIVGDGVVIIPSKYTNKVRQILNKLKVKYKIKDVFY